MSEVITMIVAGGKLELQPSTSTGTGLEYTFKTDFRAAGEILGAQKRITVAVRQLGSSLLMPIEVALVRPGASAEELLTQPDIASPNPGASPLESTFSAPTLALAAPAAPAGAKPLGVLSAINRGAGLHPGFEGGFGVVLGDTGPPGGSRPAADDRWKYRIKDDDPDGVWTLRIRNKGGLTKSFRIEIRHPDMQLTLSETAIPFALVNRFLCKVHKLVDPRLRLDSELTISFGDEFKRHTGLSDITQPIEVDTIESLRDINLVFPKPQLVPKGEASVALPLKFDFEVDGPAELRINNLPDLDITQLDFDLDFEFRGNGLFVERRNLAGDVVGAEHARGLISVGAGARISVSGLDKVEELVRSKIEAEFFGLFGGAETTKALVVAAEHFTEALMFLAVGREDRQFFDLRSTDSAIVIRHYPRPTARLRLRQSAGTLGGKVAATAALPLVALPIHLRTGSTVPTPTVATALSFAAGVKPLFAAGASVVAADLGAPPESSRKIEHIVVLMLENRSFDHMLGYLTFKKGRTDLDGLREPDRHFNPISGTNQTHAAFTLQDGKKVTVDPGHDVADVTEQIAGGVMSGFVSNYMKRAAVADRPGDEKFVMGFYDEQNLEVFDQLADEYLVCDRWFCSHPGPTYPNRFISLMGSTPDLNNLDLVTGGAGSIKGTTIFDLLSEANVSWNYVESNVAFLRMFDRYRTDESNIIQRQEWLDKARAGELPAVSWVDPHFGDLEIDDQADDDHPPANVVRGQEGVQEIYAALTVNAEQWAKTLLIVVYDEHGGFYDHVPPHGLNGEVDPVVHKIHGDGATHYGPRVPAFLVSPWVGKGSVSSRVFDHTSILKTIMVNFLGEEAATKQLLGERVDVANSLLDLLRGTRRSDAPPLAKPAPDANHNPGEIDLPVDRGSFHLAMRLFGFGPTLQQLVAARATD
jgi:phospholipase C